MSLSTMVSKAKFNLRQAAPDILVVAGVIASAVAVVDFCRQTRKAIPVIDEYNENVDKIRCAHEDAGEPDSVVVYDDKAYRKDILEETAKAGKRLAVIYARPAAIEASAIACFVGSHSVLKSRGAAMAAAYAGLGSELKALHERIVERFGKEVDYELTHGIRTEEVEERSIDPASGSEVTEKKLVKTYDRKPGDPNYYSPYARFFDESSPAWRDEPEYNLTYLKEIEYACNARLKRDGYLFLNDVYDMLGFDKTKAGQIVGWTYTARDDNPYGDNFVDFGIYDASKPANRDFVNGFESVILLDFNVDGKILDRLP